MPDQFQPDKRITDPCVVQFASQVTRVPPSSRQLVGERYAHAETPDFYEGLAAGFAAAYQMVTRLPLPGGIHALGVNLAYTAQIVTTNRTASGKLRPPAPPAPPTTNEDPA